MPAPNSGLYIIASFVSRGLYSALAQMWSDLGSHSSALLVHLPAAGRRKIAGRVVQHQHPVWPACWRGEAGPRLLFEHTERARQPRARVVPGASQTLARQPGEIQLDRLAGG